MEITEQSIQSAAKRLGARLLMKRLRLATAESCTGGWVAKVITDIAGSSDWFECAIVSYSNHSKHHFLGVPDGLLLDHGAVSENTVLAMLRGLFEQSRADAGISISGIAGPTGGSDDKPVGTVWIAWGLRGQMAHTQMFRFDGDRNQVRIQSVAAAIDALLELIEDA
jgi:nicotinamide-nucleotide amidase